MKFLTAKINLIIPPLQELPLRETEENKTTKMCQLQLSQNCQHYNKSDIGSLFVFGTEN